MNEAVERAHRSGILTTASLMVGAPAAADAVERARRMPALGVGLHVVVVNGRPVLPPERVPDLVDERGEFPTDLGRAGVRFFFSPRARRQLEEEIRAQFEAFVATGLRLDHVNAQNHMHVHPTVLSAILRVGREYEMRAVRVPREPGSPRLLAPWLALMEIRVRRAGVKMNDRVFGMNDTGRMTAERVLQILARVPDGVTEMYFHPEIGNDEFAALVDSRVIAAVQALER